MAKEKPKENQWIWGIILIFMVLGFFWFFGSFDSNEECTDYTYCVDNCVSDINDCVFTDVVYDTQRTAYVRGDNYDLCSIDLESCVSDCELNLETK